MSYNELSFGFVDFDKDMETLYFRPSERHIFCQIEEDKYLKGNEIFLGDIDYSEAVCRRAIELVEAEREGCFKFSTINCNGTPSDYAICCLLNRWNRCLEVAKKEFAEKEVTKVDEPTRKDEDEDVATHMKQYSSNRKIKYCDIVFGCTFNRLSKLQRELIAPKFWLTSYGWLVPYAELIDEHLEEILQYLESLSKKERHKRYAVQIPLLKMQADARIVAKIVNSFERHRKRLGAL